MRCSPTSPGFRDLGEKLNTIADTALGCQCGPPPRLIRPFSRRLSPEIVTPRKMAEYSSQVDPSNTPSGRGFLRLGNLWNRSLVPPPSSLLTICLKPDDRLDSPPPATRQQSFGDPGGGALEGTGGFSTCLNRHPGRCRSRSRLGKPVRRTGRPRNQAHPLAQTDSWICGKHENPASHQGLLHHSSGRNLSALQIRDRHKPI